MLLSKRGRVLYFNSKLNFLKFDSFVTFFVCLYLKKKCDLGFTYMYDKKHLATFFRNFRLSLQNNLGLGVEILLVGVYFRVKYVKKKRLLEFLLGRASFFLYFLPSVVSVRINRKKRSLYLYSFNKQQLGNVLNELVSLKFMDVYHGKGFRYSLRAVKLKKMMLKR